MRQAPSFGRVPNIIPQATTTIIMSSLLAEPEFHPVPRAKGPWTLKAESYLLFLKLGELPKGVYDPLEEAWADKGLGAFAGGLGAVMIVRYSDTPVGRFCLTLNVFSKISIKIVFIEVSCVFRRRLAYMCCYIVSEVCLTTSHLTLSRFRFNVIMNSMNSMIS